MHPGPLIPSLFFQVCGRCRGTLSLVVNHRSSATSATPGRRLEPKTPRAPTAFVRFVQDHYKEARTPGTKHQEAMQILSAQFKSKMSVKE